jgi:hypothetical protein
MLQFKGIQHRGVDLPEHPDLFSVNHQIPPPSGEEGGIL